jgi:hypothetical protein
MSFGITIENLLRLIGLSVEVFLRAIKLKSEINHLMVGMLFDTLHEPRISLPTENVIQNPEERRLSDSITAIAASEYCVQTGLDIQLTDILSKSIALNANQHNEAVLLPP